jgi:predicted secreted hydrolase
VRRAEAAVAALLVTLAVGGHAAPPWATVAPNLTIVLPRDHGAHLAHRTEWWYLTGIVRAADGGEVGWQLTFFRRGIDPAPAAPGQSALRARHVLAAHLAVADLTTGTFHHAERLRRAGAGLAWAREDDLDVGVDDWWLRRERGDRLRLHAADPATGLLVDFELAPRKPLVRHGTSGYSRKGEQEGNASAYVSWTRLATRGTVAIGKRRLEVVGVAWFDHEWGSSQLGASAVGWDWFALRLADGRDLMLYQLRRADGRPTPFSAGTVVAVNGTSRSLAAGDFTVTPRATWNSPASGAVYPARWRLTVPSAALDLEVTPRLAAAELRAERSTATTYWEGPVAVTGSAVGEGYVELTGYAGTMAGRF